jgi:hypothetical protein
MRSLIAIVKNVRIRCEDRQCGLHDRVILTIDGGDLEIEI